MQGKIPPPNWLRAFEVAARHSNFTLAAQELHVTQSAISQQVRLLENFLQEQLFQRHHRGLELTDAGRAYLEVVHQSFESIRRGTEEIFGSNNPSRITLKCNISFSSLWLPSRFAAFSKKHPDIELRVTNAVWWDRSGFDDVDLEVRFGTGQRPEIATQILSKETLTPIATPAFLQQHQIRRPEDLLKVKLLHTLGHEKGWPDWFAYAGVDQAVKATGLQFDTSTLTFEMARNNLGVALGMKSLRTALLARGDLIQPFDIELPTQECFYLVIPDHCGVRPHVKKFIHWLIEQMSD